MGTGTGMGMACYFVCWIFNAVCSVSGSQRGEMLRFLHCVYPVDIMPNFERAARFSVTGQTILPGMKPRKSHPASSQGHIQRPRHDGLGLRLFMLFGCHKEDQYEHHHEHGCHVNHGEQTPAPPGMAPSSGARSRSCGTGRPSGQSSHRSTRGSLSSKYRRTWVGFTKGSI